MKLQDLFKYAMSFAVAIGLGYLVRLGIAEILLLQWPGAKQDVVDYASTIVQVISTLGALFVSTDVAVFVVDFVANLFTPNNK